VNWEIYTYGGGEYLYTVFNAVASITQNSNYTSLLAVVAMIGLIWVIIEGAFGKELNYKWLFIMIFVYMGFMVPKANVVVTDRINPAFTRVVANVPLALAVTAGSFSQVGDYLTRTFDTVFALPDDLSYSKTGMLFGQHLMMESARFQVTDARLARNLSEFWQACVFYDVLLGLYEFDELLSAQDTWEYIKANTSKSRSFAYRTGGAARSEVIGCRAGASGTTDDSNPAGHSLTADLTAAIAKAKVYYGQKLGKGATPGEAALQFASALPISYQHLTGMSMTAEQTIRQSWMATNMARGLQSFATRVDAGAAAQDFAVARAETERRTTYAVLGELAGRTLPLIRNIFEAFVYGIFPLVFALMLLPAASKVVMTYLKALLWLQLWAPLYAILHFGMTLYSTRAASSATALLDGGSALSMATNTGLYQALADISLIAGYMAMSIPMISYLIVNQGGAMMASLAGKVMGSYEAPAAKGAEEATTGNISLGNTSMGNANWWAQNTAPSTSFGTYTHTDGMGTKHTYTQNGGEITQQQVSSYAFSASTGEAVKSSITTQAGQSVTAARQDAVEYMASTSSLFSNMKNFSHQVSAGNSTQDTATQQQSTQLAQSVEKMESVARDFAGRHGLGYETSLGMLAGASQGVKLGAGANAKSQEAYDEAVSVANQSGFKEAMQTATQISSQLSSTHQDGVTDTAAQQMQAGLQQNQALAEKASASLQRAESWSRVQARMEEHGFNFTGKIDNAIQAFSGLSRSQYLGLQQEAEQGNAAAIQQLDGLVDRFVAERGASLFGLDDAPAAYPVYNAYADYQGAVASQGQTGITHNQVAGAGQVAGAASKAGVDSDSAIPQGYQATRDATQFGMANDRGVIHLGRDGIQTEAQARGENIQTMADMSAPEAALHRISDNVMDVLPQPVNSALQFANKGVTDMTATASGVIQGVAGSMERLRTGREQDWGTDYQAGFDRVAGSDLLGTPAGTTQSIYEQMYGGEEKKSPLSDSSVNRQGEVSVRHTTMGREISYPNGEVRVGGSRSWRNNNPGNLEYGDFAKRHGATGSDGRFAIFPDKETGDAARIALLRGKYENYTIHGMVSKYAPSFENDTDRYASVISAAAGVSPDTKIASLSDEQFSRMVGKMAEHEGWRPGQIKRS